MSSRGSAAASALLMALLCVGSSAFADTAAPTSEILQTKRELVAVLIVSDGDPSLSDNLTEVAISTLAGSRDWDLVGLKELRPMLSRLDPVRRDGLDACLSHTICRADLVRATGAARVISGTVHVHGDGYSIELVLSDATHGEPERELRRPTVLTLRSLISTIQSAVHALLIAPESPNGHTPEAAGAGSTKEIPEIRERSPRTPAERRLATTRTDSDALSARSKSRPRAAHSPLGPAPLIAEQARRSKTATRYVTFGSALLSVISFSAAAVTGAIAGGAPTGDTRAEVEADLHRREGYQKAEIGLLVSGAVFATVSVISWSLSR